MKALRLLKLAADTLYVCGTCGTTMFGRDIPGSTVVRATAGMLPAFACSACPDGILEPMTRGPGDVRQFVTTSTPMCYQSQREAAICDGCGNPTRLPHFPREFGGVYCAQCCPACSEELK